MSHRRNGSAASHTSISSQKFVQYYEEKIKPRIDVVGKAPVSLHKLVDVAEKIINEKFVPDSQSTFSHANISVQVMIAMLTCAEECGGEKGKLYVASAILACSKEEDVVGALAALGTTWLTHLLFACQSYYLG